jgi:hypothetical protein
MIRRLHILTAIASLLVLGACNDPAPVAPDLSAETTIESNEALMPQNNLFLNKGPKCKDDPNLPGCHSDGEGGGGTGGGVEFDVTAVAHEGGTLESTCAGFSDFRLNAKWFRDACESVDRPFAGTVSSDDHDLSDSGAINLNADDGGFRFWLWDLDRVVYDTGVANTGTITIHDTTLGLAGGFTFHIHQALEMCAKIKGKTKCVGTISFGDVVWTPR